MLDALKRDTTCAKSLSENGDWFFSVMCSKRANVVLVRKHLVVHFRCQIEFDRNVPGNFILEKIVIDRVLVRVPAECCWLTRVWLQNPAEDSWLR